MRLPWTIQRRERIAELEHRADSSYTDALITSILASARGQQTAFPTATAALEACAGLVGRAFAAADVSGPDRIIAALDPALMNLIARALIRKGEVLLAIDVDGSGLHLSPAASHDVQGGVRPGSWEYRLHFAGPEKQKTTRLVEAAGVVHLRYAADPETPWRGVGPLQVAQLAGRLSAETVAALADEASGPRGQIMPLPVGNDPDDEDDPTAQLKTDLARLKGSLALVEGGDWGSADASKMASWDKKRIGADPPQSLINQADLASREIYAAVGINPAIFTDSQGTAAREAWRQALFGLIAPLGRIVQHELRDKLDAPDLSIDWTELRASDISGRARAFQSLVGGGMEIQQAAAVSGVLSDD